VIVVLTVQVKMLNQVLDLDLLQLKKIWKMWKTHMENIDAFFRKL
jgi:hypothetical protein